MNAIILAAGLGTRMRPLTYENPKCLLKICDYPILYWQLELLRKHNIYSVIIVVHYLASKIINYIDEYTACRREMKIKFVYESELLGSGGSLKNIETVLKKEECFLVMNGDNLTNLNLTQMLNSHIYYGSMITCGVFISERPTECGVVTLENGKITSFEEKPKIPKSNIVNAGIYIMNKMIFEYFPIKKKFSLERDIFPYLIGKINGYMINCYLRDIGNIDDYNKAQLEWNVGDFFET